MSKWPRPADIPEADWQGILKGTAFARAVGTVQGDPEGKNADGWLDLAGEYEEALKAEGYVVVPERYIEHHKTCDACSCDYGHEAKP